jgi:hypothetical protein
MLQSGGMRGGVTQLFDAENQSGGFAKALHKFQANLWDSHYLGHFLGETICQFVSMFWVRVRFCDRRWNGARRLGVERHWHTLGFSAAPNRRPTCMPLDYPTR